MMQYQLELYPIAQAPRDIHFLTVQEQNHYSSLKTDKRKSEWLAGRIAAKRLIRKAIEARGVLIEESEIPIGMGPDGAPLIQIIRSPWPLSISHSGEWAVAALSKGLETTLIGVDIEKIEARDPAWIDIAFHPTEKAETLDIAAQTRLWTLKEAISKVLGVGLSVDLYDIRLPAATDALEFHGKAREVWQNLGQPEIVFDTPALCPGYIVSVAYATSSIREEAVYG